jgi:uncharacterized protein (DUF927 family)
MGVFDNIPSGLEPATYAKQLMQAAKRFYGHPIRAFVKRLIDDLPAALDQARSVMEDFVRERPELQNAQPEVNRALRRFALVAAAGELATSFGITGWPKGAAWWGVNQCFNGWLTDRGGIGSSDMDAAVRQVRAFIEAHGNSRFQSLSPRKNAADHQVEQRIINRAGFYRNIGQAKEYLIFPECFRNEVCAGFDALSVARELDKRLFLVPGNDRDHPFRLQARTEEGRWFYCVSGEILD